MIATSNPKRSRGAGSGATILVIVLVIVAAVGWYLFFDEQKQHLSTLELLMISEEAATQLTPTQDEVENLGQRVNRLDDELRIANADLARTRADLDLARKEISERVITLAQLEQARAEYEQELGKERVLHEHTRANIDGMRSTLTELEMARAEYEQELGKERVLHEHTRANIDGLRSSLTELEMARAELEQTLAAERQAHENTRATVVALRASQNQLETARNQLNQELRTERESHQVTRETTDKLRTTLGRLRAALDAAGDSVDAARMAEADKTRLEAELAHAQRQAKMSSAELEGELRQRLEQQAKTDADILAIEAEWRKLTEELEREQAQRKQLLARISAITRDVEAKESALSGARDDVRELSQQLDLTQQQQEDLQNRLVEQEAEAKHFAELKDSLERELNETRVQITQLKNRMTVINLTSEVLFSSGSAQLKPAGRKVLSLIASSLNSYPNRAISVEGHTDTVPIGENLIYSSNWELSAARALAAVDYLKRESKVEAARLRIVGHGEYRPVASNDTVEGRQANRRIEIRLLPAVDDAS